MFVEKKKVGKVGNSLVIRLNPTALKMAIEAKEGDEVKIEYHSNKIIIRKS